MEIDQKQLREFILWIWGFLEKTQADLLAHQVVFMLLKSTGQFNNLDQLLEQARQNPSPNLLEHQKQARETLDKLLAEENPADSLMKFLREWNQAAPSSERCV